MKIYNKIIILLMITFISISLYGQSGREYRRSGVHNANLVRTVFGNWGVIGQPSQKGPRGAWLYDTNGYIGDVSPMVGAEISYYDSTTNEIKKIHSVIVCPVDRPASGREESQSGDLWTFEPVSGYFNESNQLLAMSTDPSSWPLQWPDKMDSPDDPGWAGYWNGFFGKGITNADQESFYVMDDNNDKEFNFAENNIHGIEFKPDANNPMRNGLGLEVKVRGMQWQQFLASDVIFWLYEVTNTSTYDYDKVTFGMLAGTYVGVTGTDDSPQEYNDDWSFFDVQRDLTYTGDYGNNCKRNPKWQGPVGMVGYAFLESPGNPYDGIDNDGDNKYESHPISSDLVFTAPLFEETSFDSVLYNVGDQVVVIKDDFSRDYITLIDGENVIKTRGAEITVVPGITKLIEGNINGDYEAAENCYDGIDNDLDGLIDENYLLHYRQIRVDQNSGDVLIDTLNPVAYIDYFTGQGATDPLIDEKRNDGIDNDGDWNPEFDDVGADGKLGTGDTGEGDGVPTYGEPNFDKTDVDESDQIGLTSFNYFSPANEYPMKDDELLWDWLKPGFFEVPTSIQNNEPIMGEDGDFIYGSAYFPLPAGETRSFSLALVYGNDMQDLLKNRETVQKIYDSDYRFPQPPDKPTLRVVPGDGKVTLYWDRIAETSIDPVTKEKDFEGYKIYKSTDPDFNDVRVVTNINGIVSGYKPLAQFDLINDIEGIFLPSPDLYQQAEGFTFQLGSNSGLRHSYVDTDVDNGRRYYYAVVAYDRGDASKDIFPSENTKFISIKPNGEVQTDINSTVVRPTPKAAGYDGLNDDLRLERHSGTSSGRVYYEVLDETAVNGHTYRLTFEDTQTDGLDNDNDWNYLTDDIGYNGIGENDGLPTSGEPNVDWNDLDEFAPVTTVYSVLDLTGKEETLGLDTNYINLSNKNILISSLNITKESDNIDLSNFDINETMGKIRIKPGSNLSEGYYTLEYQYYPVYRSPYIHGNPTIEKITDTDIFDGVQLEFYNNWSINAIESDTASFWNTDNRQYNWAFSTGKVDLGGGNIITGKPYPADYEIQFADEEYYVTEDAFQIAPFYFPAIKTNFRIYNLTDSTVVPFLLVRASILTSFKADSVYGLCPGDFLETFWERPDSTYQYSWTFSFTSLQSDPEDTVYQFHAGDVLHIETTKPFRKRDIFEFTPEIPEIDEELIKNQLDDIQVVPNPYVVANNMEAPLPPAITSGRGERRIEFRKLPSDATVHIFTSNGTLVRILKPSDNMHNGTLAWNLKTRENLDVAFGIYFYVIESKVGKKSGKLAIIK